MRILAAVQAAYNRQADYGGPRGGMSLHPNMSIPKLSKVVKSKSNGAGRQYTSQFRCVCTTQGPQLPGTVQEHASMVSVCSSRATPALQCMPLILCMWLCVCVCVCVCVCARRGVHQTFTTKRWAAQFRRNGKPTSLGTFIPRSYPYVLQRAVLVQPDVRATQSQACLQPFAWAVTCLYLWLPLSLLSVYTRRLF